MVKIDRQAQRQRNSCHQTYPTKHKDYTQKYHLEINKTARVSDARRDTC